MSNKTTFYLSNLAFVANSFHIVYTKLLLYEIKLYELVSYTGALKLICTLVKNCICCIN